MISKHLDLNVSPSEAVFPVQLGDLGVKVCGDELLVTRDIYDRLQNIGSLKKASDLFLFLEQAPEDVAYLLGWAPQHVYQAHWYLADLLQHYLPPSQISYPQPPRDEPLPDLEYVVSFDGYVH